MIVALTFLMLTSSPLGAVKSSLRPGCAVKLDMLSFMKADQAQDLGIKWNLRSGLPQNLKVASGIVLRSFPDALEVLDLKSLKVYIFRHNRSNKEWLNESAGQWVKSPQQIKQAPLKFVRVVERPNVRLFDHDQIHKKFPFALLCSWPGCSKSKFEIGKWEMRDGRMLFDEGDGTFSDILQRENLLTVDFVETNFLEGRSTLPFTTLGIVMSDFR